MITTMMMIPPLRVATFLLTDAVPQVLDCNVLTINSVTTLMPCHRYSIDTTTGVHLWRKELVGGDLVVAIVNYNDEAAVPTGLSLDLLVAGFSTDTRVAVSGALPSLATKPP